MPTEIEPVNSDVGLIQDDHGSPYPPSGTRPEASEPAIVPRKNGASTEEVANTTPNSFACHSVSLYLRNAKLAPRRTMPTSASTSGTYSVVIAAANDRGKPVHHITST